MLTQIELKEFVNYSPINGVFTLTKHRQLLYIKY